MSWRHKWGGHSIICGFTLGDSDVSKQGRLLIMGFCGVLRASSLSSSVFYWNKVCYRNNLINDYLCLWVPLPLSTNYFLPNWGQCIIRLFLILNLRVRVETLQPAAWLMSTFLVLLWNKFKPKLFCHLYIIIRNISPEKKVILSERGYEKKGVNTDNNITNNRDEWENST